MKIDTEQMKGVYGYDAEGMGHSTGECSVYKEKKYNSIRLGEVVEFLQKNMPCFVEEGKARRYFYIADIDDVEILAHRLLEWFKER